MGVDCFGIVADGGAGHLIADIAPANMLRSGRNERIENVERDVLLFADILSDGIKAVGEIVDENRSKVEVEALLLCSAVDAVGDHADEVGNFVLGLGIAALDAARELAIVHGDIAHESLRGPEDAIAAADRLEDLHRCGAGSVEYQSIVEMELWDEFEDSVVGDSHDIDIGNVVEAIDVIDRLGLDATGEELCVAEIAGPYLGDGMSSIV